MSWFDFSWFNFHQNEYVMILTYPICSFKLRGNLWLVDHKINIFTCASLHIWLCARVHRSTWAVLTEHVLIRSIKKTHSRFLLRYELGMEESKAGKDRLRCSLERRIFWAQSQLSSSIRSEVMKNKLRHVKSRMKHMKKTIFIILLLLNPLSG